MAMRAPFKAPTEVPAIPFTWIPASFNASMHRSGKPPWRHRLPVQDHIPICIQLQLHVRPPSFFVFAGKSPVFKFFKKFPRNANGYKQKCCQGSQDKHKKLFLYLSSQSSQNKGSYCPQANHKDTRAPQIHSAPKKKRNARNQPQIPVIFLHSLL